MKKKLITFAVITALTITTAACSPKEKVENVSTDTVVKSAELENTEAENTKAAQEQEAEAPKDGSNKELSYEFYEIYEKPETIKEFTNMDADYASYLEASPLRVLFLNKDNTLTDEITVYTLAKAEDSTALYLYTKNQKVVDAKLDEFNGDVNIEGYSYDTLLYNFDNNIDNQVKEADFSYDLLNKKDAAEKELKTKFEGKDLNTLHEFLKVYTPVQRYIRKDTSKTLEVYAIVAEAGYAASPTINVIVNDNKIEKLYIDEIYKPSNDPFETLKSAK